VFADRTEAGEALADRLTGKIGDDALVCALPRGGVPVAVPIARRVAAELDAIIVRKLRAPGQPELAMGALAGLGSAVAEMAYDRVVEEFGVPGAQFRATVERERAALAELAVRYRGARAVPDLLGRTVVLVDDGLATGSTMTAAARLARKLEAAQVIVAVPVAASGAVDSLRQEADEVVCVLVPKAFLAVGHHYADFAPPSDESVRTALAAEPRR
jgi:putative phosphoribosyl transferase